MRKSILFVIHDLGPGGAEKVLVNLVNNLDKSMFNVTVLSLFGGGVNEQFISKEVKVINAHKKMIRGNTYIFKLFTPKMLYSYYVRSHYDIVVAYLEGPCCRIVSGCDDNTTKLVGWIHIQQHSLKEISKHFRSIKEAKKAYEKFDQIVGVSDFVCDSFKKYFNLKNPMITLYNTVESDHIRKMSEETITEFKLNDSEFNIIVVGKLLVNKGSDRMIEIQKRLVSEGFNTHLYFAGNGEYRDKILRFSQENHLEEKITLLGYQTNPYKFVKNCDLFVCASLQEGFSTATTEALIVGTPVVTTDVSGMKEMLGKNNEFGVVTENSLDSLYKGIKEMITNKEIYNYYKKQAQIRGNFFNKENTLKKTESLLLNL